MLPSAVAAALSVGVVTKKSGDLAEAEAVSNRTVAFIVGVGAADGGGWLKGNESVCVGSRDMEDRIWITVVGVTLAGCEPVADASLPGLGESGGIDPGGRTANMYGLTNAGK